MERKLFFEAFPSLKVSGELREIFSDVEVTKVTFSRRSKKLNIYLESSRLIDKSAIFDMTKKLKYEFDLEYGYELIIHEKYNLSSQYTRENLFEMYKDSILLELEKESPLTKTMFSSAKVTFEGDDKIIIDFESNLLSDSRMIFVRDKIKEIYEERFGMPVHVTILKTLPDGRKFARRNEIKLQNEVENILLEREEKEGEAKPVKVEVTDPKPKKRNKDDEDVEDEEVIYKRRFKYEDITPLSDIVAETDIINVHGMIRGFEIRELRNGRYIATITITDFTDSILVKAFMNTQAEAEKVESKLKKKAFIVARGAAVYDAYAKEIQFQHVSGIMKCEPFGSEKRRDTAPFKRVELHCHTKMSDMDGISDCRKIVRRAYEWGHKAIAITDHGVVQAFPDAWHAYCDIKKECNKSGKPLDFKVIYGVEAYLVDDLKDMITDSKGQSFNDSYVVFDLETTGFSADKDAIIEIGAVKIEGGEIKDRFSTFVNPKRPIPYRIEQLTSINDSMTVDAPVIEDILPQFMEFCKGSVMVAHNAEFDMSFISANCQRIGLDCDFTVVDTVSVARFVLPELNRFKLDTVAKALQITLDHHHRAVDDAECTALIFLKLCSMLKKKGIDNLDDLNKAGSGDSSITSKMAPHHAIILVKNLTGRVNLYKLISKSHIETFANKKPRILKSDYLKLKEGLMIGSACSQGELYDAIIHGRPEAEIVRIANFYDYLEVQPLGNNSYMLPTGNPDIDDKKKFLVDSIEVLKDVNRKIYKLGKTLGKMTVATGDVHFLDPEDEIYRRIIQFGNGFKDADDQAPLYLKTTEEMLEDFEYMGGDIAEEIVIENPAMIADMIDNISPIHPDKCPPVLDNSEENLRKICYDRAHEIYGEKLPKIVEDRLEVELNSIIGNGYAVMYIMAQRLVWKSNEDGYLVGSRGSVGSSFAATMSGITEVNPLEPHYYCRKCKSSFFEHEVTLNGEAKQEDVDLIVHAIANEREAGGLGFDLPDMVCPCCGEKMKKDGIEIPFETFLGFGGTKEPDIDLNFSGEYQANAHAYTEVMFGKGHTFRAGTITGVAEKTAYGYVKNYLADHNIEKRHEEIERIAEGCTGIRKSTGQHPGGIVIVPRDKEIYEFTPVQRPANDMTTDTITTHFDYHAIDSNLLKLDILGHDDPTMIRRLESLSGINVVEEIPFDDPNVMSLFKSPNALGITSEDIGGCPTGSLGLPELGTNFVIQMLVDTQPTKFADLVRISGLSHGTDVWVGNAQDLIKEGKCTIATAICTRDDIMVYLMSKGIDAQVSFQIMEHVRKGKRLQVYTDKQGNEIDETKVMREHGVPEWYIWSCNTICYMFPKAHAAAYVMMALRVAWFKVYMPLCYYAAYFGIRAKAFDYETMCMGRNKLEHYMKEIEARKLNKTSSNKDEDSLSDMKIVQEMYARGFEFMPIDIYKAKAHDFQIIDGKLMPSLDSIEGMGEKAAEGLVQAVADKGCPFVSKNELKDMSKLSKTVIDTMSRLGMLEGLPEDSQLSIFDFGN